MTKERAFEKEVLFLSAWRRYVERQLTTDDDGMVITKRAVYKCNDRLRVSGLKSRSRVIGHSIWSQRDISSLSGDLLGRTTV